MRWTASLFWVVGLSLGLMACDAKNTPDEASVDVEGCEHLAEGPASALTATLSPDDAPLIRKDHRRYDVTLVPGTDGNGGFLRFAVDEEGDYVFFTSETVALSVQGTNGALPMESEASSSPLCEEIRGRFQLELGVGSYSLQLGPTDAPRVSLVMEQDEEHVHE